MNLICVFVLYFKELGKTNAFDLETSRSLISMLDVSFSFNELTSYSFIYSSVHSFWTFI